ncbi:hypothetical protein CV016_15945 [Yersinia kristensenii]|nr:hypothetical protein CU276_17825 [Yersinia kristensenii]PJG61811.1 hypothetical protein CV016_15945 [Yersinia kristensenii]
MPVILQAACTLAAFVHPVTYLCKLFGIMSLFETHPAGEHKCCSNRSSTNLSLNCRFPATRII